jgi:hypothetical protein
MFMIDETLKNERLREVKQNYKGYVWKYANK